MAWTTPRNWVSAELVTAALMNTHVRDNLSYLKTYSDAPQILAGSSAVAAKCGGVIYSSDSSVGNVGAGEDDLISQSIAANVLSANSQRLVGQFAGTYAANANVKRLRLYFGTDLLWDMTGSYSPNNGRWVVDFTIVRTGAATQNAWSRYGDVLGATLLSATSFTQPTRTLSSAQTLKMTGEATSNNDIVNNSFWVMWFPAP